MIDRYAQPPITTIWANENKLTLWQRTELAVIEARVNLGVLDRDVWIAIRDVLEGTPINVAWWLKRDGEISHDYNAFVDERRRHLPLHLQPPFHEDLTSYDGEEPAFATMLRESIKLAEVRFSEIEAVLKRMAQKYRYTIMMGHTHGQEAELQTFGKRCLTWLQALRVDAVTLRRAKRNLRYSKISGAIGNYGSIDPVLEREALRILGFQPFYGATQIMPRELYTPIAGALCQIVMTLSKIALDIRLGARSGQPLYQEPFGRQQKGSSRMPHKKNTISTEQVEGMARMATGFQDMIMANIRTWEERAIEQSCVERVAWPDLFHIVIHSLRVMTRILDGLMVYPDNMLREVIDSRGCYASGEAADFLSERGIPFDLSSEGAYRIVQLAAFNAFEPDEEAGVIRDNPPVSLEQANAWLLLFRQKPPSKSRSIEDIILGGALETSPELEATEDDVRRWNGILARIFLNPVNVREFQQIFSVPHLLRNEGWLYQQILGIS